VQKIAQKPHGTFFFLAGMCLNRRMKQARQSRRRLWSRKSGHGGLLILQLRLIKVNQGSFFRFLGYLRLLLNPFPKQLYNFLKRCRQTTSKQSRLVKRDGLIPEKSLSGYYHDAYAPFAFQFTLFRSNLINVNQGSLAPLVSTPAQS
jgi:hypothetical protein